MAKYSKREMADLNGKGSKRAYYQLQAFRNINGDEFIERCTAHGGWQRGTVAGVLAMVADELARQVAAGYTVSVDGLGTFSARIGVRKDKKQDGFAPEEQKRNALSLEVNGVNYRADRRLVKEIDRLCTLERGQETRLQRSAYSAEERAELARKFLREHGVMRVADYVGLTGLSRSTATRELRLLAADEASGIEAKGRYSLKVYVLKQEG